jgi:hypothetical protein
MGQSYRIKTELGISKTINVQLDQDFEFLEILSLKIQQEGLYDRSCADYGVVVGRVTANNGFGLPNARVSVFIPIDSVDQSNPLISSIYPYKSPTDKNEDGYRYNLLPYEKSYSTHAATGTLPTRLDVLTGSTAIQIYDKYYKFTSKTNESGDYMIMGVPQGQHTLVMDVDLSDIGEFSLTPQDLIRMGLATPAQVAGDKFKTSTDLNSLPQIINLTKTIDVSPLWGDPQICQIAINRTDFDLRDDANIDIQPTATFMGSIYSTADAYKVKGNCKPNDDMGNLCNLTTGPGQILAIRQTIAQDSDGNPGLEEFALEQSGNIIDGDGTWITELPMNLEYVITNQFGERVVSYDPTIGIPTKAKYRFKIKWQQPPTLSQQTRRAYFLVPNIKEHGWTNDTQDPSKGTFTQKQIVGSSYYFGLAWSGYTDGLVGVAKTNKLNDAIECNDTFYQFDFNRVYTVSSLIDEYKKTNRGQFIGIKEINSNACESTINKFPVNDGFRNFDLLFFIFSILFTIITVIAYPILIIAHILIFLYNLFISAICAICGVTILGGQPFNFICRWLNIKCDQRDFTIRLPMITYPECQSCDCKSDIATSRPNYLAPPDVLGSGALTYLSSPSLYKSTLQGGVFSGDSINGDELAVMTSEAIAGFAGLAFQSNPNRYKLPVSSPVLLDFGQNGQKWFVMASKNLPLGERINLFNQRTSFFSGINKIKVTFAKTSNVGKFHYDNTITVLSNSNTQYNAGDLLTFVNLSGSTDVNYQYSAVTATGITNGITGQTYHPFTASTSVNVTYATGQYTSSSMSYSLPYGTDNINYKFPSDIEYFQVVTAITISQAMSLWNTGTTQSFANVINSPTDVNYFEYIYGGTQGWYLSSRPAIKLNAIEQFDGYQDQYILILQRGVDPYSPKYINEYDTSILFGKPAGTPNLVFTAETRLNIPIQPLPVGSPISVQSHATQSSVYYSSYFYRPGIPGSTTPGLQFSGYSTQNLGYYGSLDANTSSTIWFNNTPPPYVISKTNNGFYELGANSTKYDNSEDVSGMGIMTIKNYLANTYNGVVLNTFITPNLGDMPATLNIHYYTDAYYPNLSTPIGTYNLNVMRTDRLPTSDKLDGTWSSSLYTNTGNPSILQQNINFGIYLIDNYGAVISSPGATLGASQVTPDIGGLPNSDAVLASFNCETMVGLNCYEGVGSTFQITPSCPATDAVEKGCYLFMRRPIQDLTKDLKTLSEWSYRFRFFYALCRGVLAESFSNNWMNGSLYMFPIQTNTFYDKQNNPTLISFCTDLIYYDYKTLNFYYRSSPYNDSTQKFIGHRFTGISNIGKVNDVNLMFPTTLMNLGMKTKFYAEITFDPSTKAYVIPNLESTSYADTSDLINFFVISRITDATVLGKIFSLGDNSLNQLFSRPFGISAIGNIDIKARIDGDLAQLLSINSEIGNVNFSPNYYSTDNGTANILGTGGDPIMAVWYSSTTSDIQAKDYITPGRIDFRSANNANYYPYPYGIKSQVVPFYQWKLDNTNTIFGNQLNNWATDTNDIVQNKGYQSLDRTALNTPNYFRPLTSSVNDLYARGYIFSMDASGNYITTGASSDKFIVGAPFQFYFGINKGKTALDKFKTKYSVSE